VNEIMISIVSAASRYSSYRAPGANYDRLEMMK
jgi:hypothetical protein